MPKKYVEKVGDDGFKKAPIGAGPYKFVSFTPGVELVLEAFEGYWRKTPSVKRLVFKVDPGRDDAAGRAQARRGRHRLLDPRRAGRGAAQYPGAHPEADRRARRSPAVLPRPVGPEIAVARPARAAGRQSRDRPQGHQPGADARLLARSPAASIPDNFEFYWQPPVPVTIRPRRSSCWPKPAIPNGFDAGDLLLRRLLLPTSARRCSTISLDRRHPHQAAAARARRLLQGLRREEASRTSSNGASGAFGNAATRLEAFVVKGGAYVYGSYPDIDELFQQQAVELDHKKREAILHKMQQLMHERTIYAPIWQLAFINGVGPRVGESGFG